jgi:hypothetical protein
MHASALRPFLAFALACAAATDAAAAPAQPFMAPLTELYLMPHTHADVGWLQTVDSLSRMNVSRILDGVVGNLMNDTQKRRRFVWDEMGFLQLWWDNQATPAQQAGFKQLVAEKRIEFTDNGWSQHDMGCTTYDSMLNNWMEGHLWIKDKFGPEARPKIGWSLDPFGMSTTQAVLQSLIGMEAWMFTRLSSNVVDSMKKSKGLEFIWRASSSLSAEETEIFCHVFESYYCMPLPTYAFEWGPDKGAPAPTDKTIGKLSEGLANIAKQRSAWFRTENVLIPWVGAFRTQRTVLVADAPLLPCRAAITSIKTPNSCTMPQTGSSTRLMPTPSGEYTRSTPLPVSTWRACRHLPKRGAPSSRSSQWANPSSRSTVGLLISLVGRY